MGKVTLSVIIPMYNVEKYIEKCLNSLKLQTLTSYEVIIVNDGSIDNSKYIAESFIKENNLKNFIILDKENGGLSDARNYGLNHATGDYICFLDSDDYVDETCYEMLLNTAINGNFSIVECSYYLTYKHKEVVKNIVKCNDIYEYAANGIVVAWNKIFKRNFIIDNKLKFIKGLYYEDVNFFYKFLAKIKDYNQIGHVSKPLIHYVQRENSISYKSTKKIMDILDIYKDVIDNVNLYEKEIEYRCVRNLCCSFRKKINNIKSNYDKKLAKTKFKKYIDINFPNWKTNKYMKKNFLKYLYIKYGYYKL